VAFDANKLTEKAQEAIIAAQRLAEDRHHTLLEPEHLLVALVGQEGGVVPAVLEKLGVQPRSLLQQAESAVGTLPRMTTRPALRYVNRVPNARLFRLETGSRQVFASPLKYAQLKCLPSLTVSRSSATTTLSAGTRMTTDGECVVMMTCRSGLPSSIG
jgi:ATP-dependent Clp protease ATP-binding subunit ClpA